MSAIKLMVDKAGQRWLPFDAELLDALVERPLAKRLVYAFNLNYKDLVERKEQYNLEYFETGLPGQEEEDSWRLLLCFKATETVTLRVWRYKPKSSPCPAILLRLFLSNGEAVWGFAAASFASDIEVCTADPKGQCADLDIEAKDFSAAPEFAGRCRLEIVFLHTLPIDVPLSNKYSAVHDPQSSSIAAGFLLSRVPHDVKLFFPSASTTGAALWSSADSLTAFSPYFKTLLSSDFSEAVTRYTSEQNEPGPEVVQDGTTEDFVAEEVEKDSGEDSDDELDELFFSSPPSSLSSDSSATRPYRRVTVRGAWSTYRAVLAYSTSGYLSFAPLRSSRLSEIDSSSHLDALKKQLTNSPNVPLPVSPKSVYRAAHLLELPTLSSLALGEFRRQLTPSIAVVELFTPTAAEFDELRKVALNYVVKSWAECKDLEEMKEAKEKVKRGEWPHGGAVMVELLDKLEEKRAALA